MKNRKKPLTDEEKLEILIPKAMDYISERVGECVPKEGTFSRFSVSFDYPGSTYKAMLWVEPNLTRGEGNARLVAGMRESDSDRVVQHYMTVGTGETLCRWLSSEEGKQQLRQSYAQLKEAVDRMD